MPPFLWIIKYIISTPALLRRLLPARPISGPSPAFSTQLRDHPFAPLDLVVGPYQA